MTIENFLTRLDGVRRSGKGHVGRCPAHQPDRTPSLSVKEGDRGILLKCFAGCSVDEITAALGLQVADLFTDAPLPRDQRPPVKVPCCDRRAVAFRFELCALDLRLRAEKIIEAGKALDVEHLSDDERDRAMNAVVNAHDDEGRAELFEQVADDLRMTAYLERQHHDEQP
jgi:hypothetical protein